VCETEFGGVVTKYLYLTCRDGICNGQVNVGSRNVVIFCCNREVGATQRAPCHTKTVECLGTCDFVYQVQVNVEKVGFTVGAVNHVLVPHLLGEC
jgi:hypothetical protein